MSAPEQSALKPAASHDPETMTHPKARAMLLVYAGPVLLGLICVVAYALHINGKPLGDDFVRFHVAEINHFIAHPLGFDTAPPSAGAIPGYHWLQAMVLKLTGHDRVPSGFSLIRLVHTAIGIGAFTLLARLLTRLGRDAVTAILLSLLLCVSYYPLQMTYYSNTEAPAFLFFMTIIALCARPPDRLRGAEIGSCALAMVLMRDSLASTLPAPLALLALRRSWLQAAIFCLYGLVIALIIYAYWLQWGGLTSPQWQSEAFPSGGVGFSVASTLHAFALTGLFSVFLVGPLYREFFLARTHRCFWFAAGMLAVVVAALWWIGPSTYSPWQNRRYSIVWTLAALTPAVGHSSPIVLALALAAVPMLALMVSRMARDRTLYPDSAMAATCVAGQFVADVPWQRYVEVPILVGLGLFAARFASSRPLARLPLAVLVAAYCAVSIFKFLVPTP
jgi:hypothetical protein